QGLAIFAVGLGVTSGSLWLLHAAAARPGAFTEMLVLTLANLFVTVMRFVAESDAVSRPAIVTVDDDPSVSRAVARDLRRQYGAEHRIVRGESGEQVLEALRELKLRGEQVAVILADYRMPNMNGIEFLEKAMDIFPSARRVLLTAYADTDAAIQAINVVDVDHYLLKPWDPPEEKLYPVVDALVEAWKEAGDREL